MAKPVEFPQQNVILGENQPEYQPLPAFISHTTPRGEVVTCWELSEEDINVILETKKIWLTQLTFRNPLQPISVTTDCPLTEEVNAPLN